VDYRRTGTNVILSQQNSDLLHLHFNLRVAYFVQKALAGLRRIDLEGLRWRVFDAKGQVRIPLLFSVVRILFV
jgi:hypothetical protein